MNILEIGNIKIPAFEKIDFKNNTFRLFTVSALAIYTITIYLKSKHYEKKVKEIIEG